MYESSSKGDFFHLQVFVSLVMGLLLGEELAVIKSTLSFDSKLSPRGNQILFIIEN